MYITQEIANRIKLALKSKNIKMKQMTVDLNIGINAISEFSKGKQLSCISLARIADYLNCSVDYLLGRTDDPGLSAPGGTEAQTKQEEELLLKFRQLNQNGKEYLLTTAELAFANQEFNQSGNEIYFYGDIAAFGGGTQRVRYTKEQKEAAEKALDTMRELQPKDE